MPEISVLAILAGCQILFLDREDCARFDCYVLHGAAAARHVCELRIIYPRRHITDDQPFIEIDTAILVILTLVRTPIRCSGRGQIELRNRVFGQIPESCRSMLRDGFANAGRYGKRQYEDMAKLVQRRLLRTALDAAQRQGLAQEWHAGKHSGPAYRGLRFEGSCCAADNSCTAMRIRSGRLSAFSFCLSCELTLTTVL